MWDCHGFPKQECNGDTDMGCSKAPSFIPWNECLMYLDLPQSHQILNVHSITRLVNFFLSFWRPSQKTNRQQSVLQFCCIIKTLDWYTYIFNFPSIISTDTGLKHQNNWHWNTVQTNCNMMKYTVKMQVHVNVCVNQKSVIFLLKIKDYFSSNKDERWNHIFNGLHNLHLLFIYSRQKNFVCVIFH